MDTKETKMAIRGEYGKGEFEINVRDGAWLVLDSWPCGTALLGDPCGWRLVGPNTGVRYLVDAVEITGRKIRDGRVRVAVTLNDGITTERVGGWAIAADVLREVF